MPIDNKKTSFVDCIAFKRQAALAPDNGSSPSSVDIKQKRPWTSESRDALMQIVIVISFWR